MPIRGGKNVGRCKPTRWQTSKLVANCINTLSPSGCAKTYAPCAVLKYKQKTSQLLPPSRPHVVQGEDIVLDPFPWKLLCNKEQLPSLSLALLSSSSCFFVVIIVAAVETCMSLCLFWDFRTFRNDPAQCLRKCAEKCAEMCDNVLSCARVCWNVRQCAEMCFPDLEVFRFRC